MANKKYKLTDGNYWATDGIHDFGQNKTQREINAALVQADSDLSGAITHKLDYLELGDISGATNEAAIEAAFNAVTVYDKPVSIKFSHSGFWSGIVYKYSALNYGTIYATYPVDKISYFGYMVNGTFNLYLNATEADISALQTALNTIIPLDTVPTNGSYRGITSNAVYTALNATKTITTQVLTQGANIESGRAEAFCFLIPNTNLVYVQGFINNISTIFGTNDVLFTIPAALKPTGERHVPANIKLQDNSIAYWRIIIDANGDIKQTLTATGLQMVFSGFYTI